MARELATALREAAPEAKLVAGYDPFAPARQEPLRDASGWRKPRRWRRCLARADIGAVLIASPNFLHKEHTLAAAAAGKHVFCEKPMALSVADCDAMLGATARAGVKLMVGHSTRLMPPMRRLRAVVESGELGRLLFGQANYWFTGFKQRDSGVWHLERAKCGGLFYQMGIHQIDLFHAIFGPTRRVQYVGGRYGAQIRDFDDIATILLEFASGATGSITVCGMAPVVSTDMGFILSDGYVKSEGSWGRLEFGRDPEHRTVLGPGECEGPGGVQMELASFVRWVQHGEAPVLTGAEGRAAVAVAEAADRAKETGAPVEVA